LTWSSGTNERGDYWMTGWHVPVAWHDVAAQQALGFDTQLPPVGMHVPVPVPESGGG
jgi:hypothetical protein